MWFEACKCYVHIQYVPNLMKDNVHVLSESKQYRIEATYISAYLVYM